MHNFLPPFAALLATLTLFTASEAGAQAQCAQVQQFTRDETRELMSLMVAPEADPLEQLFAFEDLMCASNPVVRNMALKAGASSGSADVRSQILFRALTQQQIIRVELGDGRKPDGTSGEFSSRVLELPVSATNDVAGSISSGGAACNQNHHLQLMGSGIRVYNLINLGGRWQLLSGDMAYSHGDAIEGELRFIDTVYPATINLF